MRNLLELYDSEQPKQNVLEDFVKYYIASIVTGDVDPEYPLINYLKKQLNFNQEELLWYCWIYGATYHEGSAHYIYQNLSEPMPSLKKFTSWHEKHQKLIDYGRDLRGSRLKLHLKYKDYKEAVDKYGSQMEFFKDKTYMQLWEIFRKQMYLFGRYSTYFYLETLKRCANIPISTPTMFLEESWSPRRGVCHIFHLPFKTTSSETASEKGKELLDILRDRMKDLDILSRNKVCKIVTHGGVDYEYLETVLCAFRGACENHRYVGYYIDRMQGGIIKMEQKIGRIFIDLWEARAKIYPEGHLGELHNWRNIRKPMLFTYTRTGEVVDLEPTKQMGFL